MTNIHCPYFSNEFNYGNNFFKIKIETINCMKTQKRENIRKKFKKACTRKKKVGQ